MYFEVVYLRSAAVVLSIFAQELSCYSCGNAGTMCYFGEIFCEGTNLIMT